MKKILLFFTFLCLSTGAFAQFEIGFKVSPTLTWQRVETTPYSELGSIGSEFNFGGGIVADYFFSDNYAFGTGLLLSTKSGKLGAANRGPLTWPYSIEVMVQYVELPVTLKLFTNELAPNTRLYAQIGGVAGVLAGAKIDNKKSYEQPILGNPDYTIKAKKLFNSIEISGLLSAGVEYRLGENTKLFSGLYYQHGLTNMEDKDFPTERGGPLWGNNDDVTIKNSVIGIDLGIKF